MHEKAFHYSLSFSSSYLSEHVFSAMNNIKSNNRIHIVNVEDDEQVSLSDFVQELSEHLC